MLLVFVLIFTQGCGVILYEIISSSQFIEDDDQDAPIVNIKMYPEPKKKGINHDRKNNHN